MTHSGYRTSPPIERHPNNPILTAANWPYQCNTVFNPGATLLADGTTLLLCRVEDMRGHSHLTVARSKDGVSNWDIDPEPTLLPDIDNFSEDSSNGWRSLCGTTAGRHTYRYLSNGCHSK